MPKKGLAKRARRRRTQLDEHPISPQEAARIICLVHTRSSDFRPIIGVIPDFAKTSIDLYEEAWRVLRRFGLALFFFPLIAVRLTLDFAFLDVACRRRAYTAHPFQLDRGHWPSQPVSPIT